MGYVIDIDFVGRSIEVFLMALQTFVSDCHYLLEGVFDILDLHGNFVAFVLHVVLNKEVGALNFWRPDRNI